MTRKKMANQNTDLINDNEDQALPKEEKDLLDALAAIIVDITFKQVCDVRDQTAINPSSTE